MGLGAIEAIEAAGKKPGKDIKIITVDAVKDGMKALADGKINFIVECNPLLGPQLMDLAEKVVAGEEVPERVVTEETTFDPGAGHRGPARPPVLTTTSPSARWARPGAVPGPASPRRGTRTEDEERAMTQMDVQPPRAAGPRLDGDDRRRPVVEMRDISHRLPRGPGARRRRLPPASRARCTP